MRPPLAARRQALSCPARRVPGRGRVVLSAFPGPRLPRGASHRSRLRRLARSSSSWAGTAGSRHRSDWSRDAGAGERGSGRARAARLERAADRPLCRAPGRATPAPTTSTCSAMRRCASCSGRSGTDAGRATLAAG
ncbi:MAG: hypothetical protein MZV64_30835 [Ignavibacteriales bacterium]|nr:hypothetical protein [Ignavibacteriales bacterium]